MNGVESPRKNLTSLLVRAEVCGWCSYLVAGYDVLGPEGAGERDDRYGGHLPDGAHEMTLLVVRWLCVRGWLARLVDVHVPAGHSRLPAPC